MRSGKIETSRRICACLLITVLAAGGESACRAENQSPFAQPEEQPVTATLIAEHDSMQPGGSTRIGILCEIEDGWHIYAQAPGDAGLPTKVTWLGPAWVLFSPLQWPAPEEFHDPGDIRTFGYKDEVLLVSTLAFGGAEIAIGTGDVPVRANVTWLACKEVCIPGKAELALTLPISRTPPAPSARAELFAATK